MLNNQHSSDAITNAERFQELCEALVVNLHSGMGVRRC